ncbi:anthranilate synthase component I family protein [Azospirillum baldaniorum]|uniref:anthranilate synthase component I family protein n=1 Tax=Azospirillum baldaniorum TaxID=1064539 RepID=UPI001FCC9DA7|nr:anthranilate synthase component I family protein [Azospirillum baldaniorum]
MLEYIRAGDIYQANFTQRFLAERRDGLDSYALYRRLRAISPAPFAAYLDCGPRLRIASASPERFIRLSAAGEVETRPIKGTRPRYADPAADAAAAAELVASVKDRAENLMITDLLRNDLGRVSRVGSVRVPTLYGLESFASVHHLVSVVTARLRPGLGAVDLLRAALPGGSITGAPKIRAMQIIDELEVARRGAYCGSVAWLGFDGAMDSSIVIRTLSITPDTVIAQAGGGIVADSDPADEHEEMMVKIRAQLRALGEERA